MIFIPAGCPSHLQRRARSVTRNTGALVYALTVRDDLALATPEALTPTAWLAFGFDEDLDEAAVQALNGSAW